MGIIVQHEFMRQVVSLSLPEETVKSLKSRAKENGFRTVSAYIKHLVEADTDLISEEELLEIIEQGEKDYREGKTKPIKSLLDLV